MIYVVVGIGACGHEKGGELANGDEDESPQNERSVPMAYDPQMASDSEVFPENWDDIRINLKDLGEVLETEDLKAADEAEQNAYQEEHHRSVEPRT